MKKFLSLSLVLTMLALLLTSCSTTTIQITPENFEQYFEISVITEDYESDGVGFFADSSTATVTISIVPKQTVSSGKSERHPGEPTAAFKGATWAALLIGVAAYFIGLFNASMQLNEKGYYFAVLVFGLYSAVSLQKAVRDKD